MENSHRCCRIVVRLPRPSHLSIRSCIGRYVHGSAELEKIPVGISPGEAYDQLVTSGAICPDKGQFAALQPLERLHRELKDYKPPRQGLASRILRAIGAYRSPQAPRGVYIYGGVGTGKSLVADIFYHCSPVKSKRRVHFHQFMLEVHRRLLT